MGKHSFHKAILLALLFAMIGGAVTPARAGASSTPAELTWLFGSGSATGGKYIHLRATLSGEAPAGGAVIKLTTTSPIINPPATATVPAGKTEVIVAIKSLAVHESTPVTITATYRNRIRTHTTLILRPYLSSMTIQSQIESGGTGRMTVRLSGIAPQGGITVYFSTSRPSLVPVPPTVHFPAGSASVTYIATGAVVNKDVPLNVSSKHRGITITKPTVLLKAVVDTQTPPPTATATATEEPTATATATDEPTATATATDEPTATATATDEPTATATATATDEPTATATATDEPTATATATDEPTATATATDEPTATATATATATDVPTATATATDVPTATATATDVPTATATATDVPTATATATAEPTATATATEAPANPVVVMCHMVGDETYNLLAPHASGIVNGHIGEDTGDIIPPFVYQGVTYVQNWDESSQAIFNNNCVVPTEVLNQASQLTEQGPTGDQGEGEGSEPTTYGLTVSSDNLTAPKGGTIWFTVCLSEPATGNATIQWYAGQATFDDGSNVGSYTFGAGEQCVQVALNGLKLGGGAATGSGNLVFVLEDGQVFYSPEATFRGK